MTRRTAAALLLLIGAAACARAPWQESFPRSPSLARPIDQPVCPSGDRIVAGLGMRGTGFPWTTPEVAFLNNLPEVLAGPYPWLFGFDYRSSTRAQFIFRENDVPRILVDVVSTAGWHVSGWRGCANTIVQLGGRVS
jgi:hypothetical protein